MTDSTAPRPRIDLAFPLLSALLVLAWSTGFLGVRGLSDSTPILTILFWRSLMSGLILLPFALTLGPRLDARAVLEQAGFGTFGMFPYLGGFSLAIGQGVPTGLVALITDMLPMGVALLAGPILNQRLTPRQWLGMGTGVAGVALVSSEGLRLGDVPLWALLLPVAGTMARVLARAVRKAGAFPTMASKSGVASSFSVSGCNSSRGASSRVALRSACISRSGATGLTR